MGTIGPGTMIGRGTMRGNRTETTAGRPATEMEETDGTAMIVETAGTASEAGIGKDMTGSETMVGNAMTGNAMNDRTELDLPHDLWTIVNGAQRQRPQEALLPHPSPLPHPPWLHLRLSLQPIHWPHQPHPCLQPLLLIQLRAPQGPQFRFLHLQQIRPLHRPLRHYRR